MKKVLYFVLTLVVILCCAIGYGANYLVDYSQSLPRDNYWRNMDSIYAQIFNKYPEMEAWRDSLQASGLMRDTMLLTHDGTYRRCMILEQDSAATGATVMIHGYQDSSVRMLRYGFLHYEGLHRNVILPDLYGHGLSDGENIRFGWLDSQDCAQDYLPLAHNLWPELDIVQHGLSMGGATTMMTSGIEIPDSLRLIGFIEDCGYSSTWDQMVYQLDSQFGLPAFPMLYVADWITEWRYGWSMKESSAIKQLNVSTKPMLFIHGDADDFVPTAMVQKNFEAKTQGYKELWIVPGAAHAKSIHIAYDEYVTRVSNYIDKIK